MKKHLLEPLRRSWFHLAVVFLLAFSAINLSGRAFWTSLMGIGWVQRLIYVDDPLIDEEHWEPWLGANAALFRALAPGAKVGILNTLAARRGAMWAKEGNRMVFRVSGDVKAEDPGLILCFSEATAEVLLSAPEEEGARTVQQLMRNQFRAGKIQTFYLKTSQRLQEEGLPEFLRAIGAWRGGPPFEVDQDPPQAGYRLLTPRGWSAAASHTSAGTAPGAAIDGTQESSWQSGAAMDAQMSLQVDLGGELTVAGVELLNPWENRRDYPRGLEVALSRDGRQWSVVAQRAWLGEEAPRDGDVWVPFAPAQARFIRLRQTEDREQNGRAIGWWWSVGELRVYAPEEIP